MSKDEITNVGRVGLCVHFDVIEVVMPGFGVMTDIVTTSVMGDTTGLGVVVFAVVTEKLVTERGSADEVPGRKIVTEGGFKEGFVVVFTVVDFNVVGLFVVTSGLVVVVLFVVEGVNEVT